MDSIFSHPLTTVPSAGRHSKWQAVPTGSTSVTRRLATRAAVTICVLLIVAVAIGDFTLEIILRARPNSVIGMHFFTDKFDHLDRLCFAHTTSIGRLRIEASLGSLSPFGVIDFANVGKGAESIPALTSPSYSPSIQLDLTCLDRTLWKSFSPRPVIHPPEMALSGGNSPGQCWAFIGHTGQLGIQLPAPLRVASFTIEHTGNSSFIASALRNIVLWGLIRKDSKDVYSVPKPSTHIIGAITHLGPQFGSLYKGIPLASVTFDAVQGPTRQTFLVRCYETRRPFDSLVVQFVGNWGHPDFTCLYRFEVNGEVMGRT